MKKDVRFAPARWQSRRQIALWLQLADTDGTQPAMPDMLALWLLLSNLAVSWRDSMSRSPPMSAMTLPPAMTAPLILASPLKTVTLSPPLTWVLRLVAPLPSSWVSNAGRRQCSWWLQPLIQFLRTLVLATQALVACLLRRLCTG